MFEQTTFDLAEPEARRGVSGQLYRWLLGSTLLLTGLMSVVLTWRRAVGALARPLPGATLVALGLLLAAAGFAIRWFARRSFDESNRGPTGPIVAVCATAFTLFCGAAVSVPSGSPFAMAVFWLILLLGEAAGRRLAWIERRCPVSDPSNVSESTNHTPVDDLSVAEATRRFTRGRSAESGDVLTGWMRLTLPTGLRALSEHVAFCPPFARTPTVEVEQMEGPPCRVQVGQALPHGARIDLKRTTTTDARSAVVAIRFSARLTDDGEPEKV